MPNVELPDVEFRKNYAVGSARQLLRPRQRCTISAVEKIKVGPRSHLDCLVLDNGERIAVTRKRRLERPAGVDGVLLSKDDGSYEWISHRILDSVKERIERVGLGAYTKEIAQAWPSAFHYRAQGYDQNRAPLETEPGLRPPQLGALFAIASHWTLSRTAATIVMPTGTGL